MKDMLNGIACGFLIGLGVGSLLWKKGISEDVKDQLDKVEEASNDVIRTCRNIDSVIGMMYVKELEKEEEEN